MSVKNIIIEICSASTWRKIQHLCRYKSPGEGLKPLRKEDILPLTIIIFFALFFLAITLVIALSI